MSIEKGFDVSFIADLALREKQIQQNYRPIIGVHKWFARRPGTLFRGLLLAEFGRKALRDAYFSANDLGGIRIADPFMGGGTPLLEANRLGCDVIGYDVNPMAHWIVSREIEHLDLNAYREEGAKLTKWLDSQVGHLYRTSCVFCGSASENVKYFLWVKVHSCRKCGKDIDLFPGHLIAENRRHPNCVFVCPSCGSLRETKKRESPGKCPTCSATIGAKSASRNQVHCAHCGEPNTYPNSSSGPPRHRMFAMEYVCRSCRHVHSGRFFKKPDDADLANFREAQSRWAKTVSPFVPDDKIPPGDESDRLHRWGYGYYKEMFNERQLLGLELSCRFIANEASDGTWAALATNLSDLLRYQNMLCRYDTMALKSLDVFSVHGFPIGLVQCESNLLGIPTGPNTSVGSGGWSNILQKYARAKAYCDEPFEVMSSGGRKRLVPVQGEWIGEERPGRRRRRVVLRCKTATAATLPRASLDAVLTDPPYFGNVQYAELMDFCYVWLRRLVRGDQPSFQQVSTRNQDELTENASMDRGVAHFTDGLSKVFQRMGKALKPGAPLAFTYHHNHIEAYYPLAVAILDAGLTCSASIPCPGEMGGSIHINGTGSSVVDTVFVCRSTGLIPRSWVCRNAEELAILVRKDLRQLADAGLAPTRGDIRCVVYGHLIRLSVWRLRASWNKTQPTLERLKHVADSVDGIGGVNAVEANLHDTFSSAPSVQHFTVREAPAPYKERAGDISF